MPSQQFCSSRIVTSNGNPARISVEISRIANRESISFDTPSAKSPDSSPTAFTTRGCQDWLSSVAVQVEFTIPSASAKTSHLPYSSPTVPECSNGATDTDTISPEVKPVPVIASVSPTDRLPEISTSGSGAASATTSPEPPTVAGSLAPAPRADVTGSSTKAIMNKPGNVQDRLMSSSEVESASGRTDLRSACQIKCSLNTSILSTRGAANPRLKKQFLYLQYCHTNKAVRRSMIP